MALVFENDILQTVCEMEFAYQSHEHQLTVNDVAEYALDEGLTKATTIQVMSYLYGVYEKIAVYGNDCKTRQRAVAMMNIFDKALNHIDVSHNDYSNHLADIVYHGEEVLDVPPGLGCEYGLTA